MESGFSDRVPCHTVTMACISSNMAVATGKVLLVCNMVRGRHIVTVFWVRVVKNIYQVSMHNVMKLSVLFVHLCLCRRESDSLWPV